jgi:hypothetical protein
VRENNCGPQGTLPIAIGFGAGAESRRPLGLAVVGGLILSQLLTLYITPVTYTYLDSFGTWLGNAWRRRNAGGESAVSADAVTASRARAPFGHPE